MPWPRLKPRPAPQNAQSEANLPLNHDVFLVIFSYLGIADILAIRQTCRRLRDLTHERSVWSWRYAAMIEEMQLPRPKEDPNLSTAELESAVKRHQLVESAWYRARPHMQSLRTVAFSVFAYPWLNHLRRVFVAPGGQYLLFITSLGIYILHVDKPPALLAPFIQWSHIDTTPFDMSTCRWVTGKPGDGSVTLFAELRGLGSDLGPVTYFFWSADPRVSPPTQTYLGRFTTPSRSYNSRTKNEFFMYSYEANKYMIILDWKALLNGLPFRYSATRYGEDPTPETQGWGVKDFCLLPNGYILAISSRSSSLCLFSPPQFQTVLDPNQPLPSSSATPIWEHHFDQTGPHICTPSAVWTIPLLHRRTGDTSDGSSALLHSRSARCCYRVTIGPEGPRVVGHKRLQATSRFIPNRTKALSISHSPNVDGSQDACRVECISYSDMANSSDCASESSFELTMDDIPQLEGSSWPSRSLVDSQVHFDEESGRISFTFRNRTPMSHEVVVLLLDLV